MARKKTDKLSLRIDPSIKEALQKAAEAEHRSVANLLEVLVLKHCEAQNIPVKKDPQGQEKEDQ